MKMAEASWGPPCSWFSASHTGQFIGSAQLREGVALLLLTCQETLLGLYAVKRSNSCTQFTLCYIRTPMHVRTQQETQSTELKHWHVDPKRSNVGLEQKSSWERGTSGGSAPQTPHHSPLLKTWGFAIGNEVPPHSAVSWSRKQCLLLLSREAKPYSWISSNCDFKPTPGVIPLWI